MDIIALFCDIDYFLFLKDKQIVAYSNGWNSADRTYTSAAPKKVGFLLGYFFTV